MIRLAAIVIWLVLSSFSKYQITKLQGEQHLPDAVTLIHTGPEPIGAPQASGDLIRRGKDSTVPDVNTSKQITCQDFYQCQNIMCDWSASWIPQD